MQMKRLRGPSCLWWQVGRAFSAYRRVPIRPTRGIPGTWTQRRFDCPDKVPTVREQPSFTYWTLVGAPLGAENGHMVRNPLQKINLGVQVANVAVIDSCHGLSQ